MIDSSDPISSKEESMGKVKPFVRKLHQESWVPIVLPG